MKKILKLRDIDTMLFSGVQDSNLKFIEDNFKGKIVLRGDEIHFDGNKDECEKIEPGNIVKVQPFFGLV